MKEVNAITETTINRPVETVSAFAADPDNATKWYRNIRSVEWKTPRPLGIGSLLAFKARFLGRELAYTYEVVEHVPGKRFVMRTADGPFPMETTYEWERINDRSTRMKLQNRGVPSGFSRLFAPFMERMMRRENLKDLELLKRLLES
jgi:hypothetical protein